MADTTKYDPVTVEATQAGYIRGEDAEGRDFTFAQVRGWGYLTGHGQALGLSGQEAIAIQDSWAERLAQAWEKRQIADLAIRLYDCQCEFEDDPSCCGEHQDDLDSAIGRYKAKEAERSVPAGEAAREPPIRR